MGAGNNLGIDNTKSDFVLILNPDVILSKDTIEKLINALISFSIVSLDNITSGFKIRTKSDLVLSIPKLFPAPMPILCLDNIHETFLYLFST